MKSLRVKDAPMPSMMIIIITPSSLVSNSVTMCNSAVALKRD